MAEAVEDVREFVLQIEKVLITRRLYAPHMATYVETSQRLLEKCGAALGEQGFTLRVGPMDLFLGKTSLLNRPKREDCYFFPLYRDGLREMSFATGVTPEELEALMRVFEAEEKRLLGASEDTVSFLWRCDLASITYSAIDGIGDQEGDDEGVASGGDDYRALVAELVAKIQDPAPPSTGQSYAFVLDADVKVAATDFHYEATTQRRAFADNPTVLALAPEEAQAIRAELDREREVDLLSRFVAILFAILEDPRASVPAASLTPVLGKLLEGYWAARDFEAFCVLLRKLAAAAESVPSPENRTAARELVVSFHTPERIRHTTELVKEGALPLETAEGFWGLGGEAVVDLLINIWAGLPEGAARTAMGNHLKRRIAAQPDLLRVALRSTEARHVRAALSLMDERLSSYYAAELLALVSHADENVRLKGVQAAGRLGGDQALEALWRAMEADASKSVRLQAYRLVAASKVAGLAERLQALVTAPAFSERPAWEREKYVRLLGSVAGDAARPLFESWIPGKRWFWQAKDLEQAELAFHGLAACGGAGLERVKAVAAEGGKLGEAAKKALAGGSR